MTTIKIIRVARYASYAEVTYKMSFTLPAIFGTGNAPIDGLSSIATSYGNNWGVEVIPVTGTVITYTATTSVDLAVTLAAAKTFLQSTYTSLRAQLDALVLSPYDSLNGLSFDGTNWTASSLITDLPVVNGSQSNLCVTNTAAAGVIVTLTLPAVVGNFHSISRIEITAYTTVARVGSATPIIVTSTNIPGSPAWTFATAAAVGTTDTKTLEPDVSIKSSVANTATTIVCPATASIIWRVTVFYNVSQ